MEAIITYIILTALYISILYGCYKLLAWRNYNFSLHRVIILSSLLLGIALPCFQIGAFQEVIYSYTLPMVEFGSAANVVETMAQNPAIISIDLFFVLGIVLGLGSLFFAIRFIYGCVKLSRIVIHEERIRHHNYLLIKTDSVKSPSSFYRYIFVPTTFSFEDESAEIILSHEANHLRLRHSFDSVFCGLLQILFWWLPTFYGFQKDLKLVHEYEVDTIILKNNNTFTYANFLIEQVPIHRKLLLTNNFYSFIKKRINMMYQKKKSRFNVLKYGVYALVIPTLFIFQSFQSKHNLAGEQFFQTGDNGPYEEVIQDTIFIFDPVTKTETVKYETIRRMVYKEVDQLPMISSCVDLSLTEDEIKQCCSSKLMQYIGTNMKYPEEAKKSKAEGKVIAEFVITDEGEMESIKIVKEIGYGTGEAVAQVLMKLSNGDLRWTPGMENGQPVNVKYTLPVQFKMQ